MFGMQGGVESGPSCRLAQVRSHAAAAAWAEWRKTRAGTVALCAACRKHVERWQGPTRARPLPFPLVVSGGGGVNRRPGPCVCGCGAMR